MSESMKLDFKDKVVIITGAGGIMGSAMSKEFARNGAKVAGADITVEALENLVKEVRDAGGDMIGVQADVGSKESASALIDQAVKKYGRIDVLVNNAGVNLGGRKEIHEFAYEDWEKCINIDLNGVFYCSKPAIHQMIKNGGGSIINIASIIGVTPAPLQSAFAAAKGGVVNLTRAMAAELGKYNIRVNAICPGSTEKKGSNAFKDSLKENSEAHLSFIPLGRIGAGEDISALTCFLASAEASYITGAVHVIDGGWICHAPRNFKF
jgi:NAD(P)-dependent dehydrogenase (short-subunit alcohol dehydrogenase family)